MKCDRCGCVINPFVNEAYVLDERGLARRACPYCLAEMTKCPICGALTTDLERHLKHAHLGVKG